MAGVLAVEELQFNPKHRNYLSEQDAHALERSVVLSHPLSSRDNSQHADLHSGESFIQPNTVRLQGNTAANTVSSSVCLPFSNNFDSNVLYDPLTAAAAEFGVDRRVGNTISNGDAVSVKSKTFLPSSSSCGSALQQELNDCWTCKRVSIVVKHTPAQRLPLVAGFLFSREKDAVVSPASRVSLQGLRRFVGSVGRIQNRLAILQELDADDETAHAQSATSAVSAFSSTFLGGNEPSSTSLHLSEEQVVIRVHQTKRQLRVAWEKDQRVIALRHLIQCVKLLGDAQSNPLFYPTKFILVTDVLDLFTALLFERLLDKSELPKRVIRSARDVSEKAKEICRNWLYKITCIRELLPRILIEIAILPCMRFIEDADSDEGAAPMPTSSSFYQQAFVRLQKMIRGIGDPLVAIWCRCYLAKVACCSTVPSQRHQSEHLRMAVEDFVRSQSHIGVAYARCNENGTATSNKTAYIETYSSALEWILECMARIDKASALSHLLMVCGNNRLLLRATLAAFDPPTIAAFVLVIQEKIRDMIIDTDVPDQQQQHRSTLTVADVDAGVASRAQLIRSLGAALGAAHATALDTLPKRKVLNLAWQIISPLRDLAEYTDCVQAWCEFATRMLGRKEIDIILADLLLHIEQQQQMQQRDQNVMPNGVISKHMSNGSLTTNDVARRRRTDSTTSSALNVVHGSSSLSVRAEKQLKKAIVDVVVQTKQVQDNLLRICEYILARPGGSKQLTGTAHIQQLFDLFNSAHMLKLLDVLHNGSNRYQAARAVADAFYRAVQVANASASGVTPTDDFTTPVAYGADTGNFTTNDPVLINTLQSSMRTVADALDALASDDERRNINRILAAFICCVDYGRDLDAQLNFYVQCRENFYRFDDTLALLVQLALLAAMRARSLRVNKAMDNSLKNSWSKLSSGAANVIALRAAQSSRRTVAFVHSCCAYAFITIPSVGNSATMQYKLYLHLTQVCLANQCLGQAEASLRAAFQLLYSENNAILSEVAVSVATSGTTLANKSSTNFMQNGGMPTPFASADDNSGAVNNAVAKLVAGAFSVLLIMPDKFVLPSSKNRSQQQSSIDKVQIDALYWYRGFMNACDVFCDAIKYVIKVDSIAYLCAASQVGSQYCLHVAGIDSNDTLYSATRSASSDDNQTEYAVAVQQALDTSLRNVLTYIADCTGYSERNSLDDEPNTSPAGGNNQLSSGFVVLEALLNVMIAHADSSRAVVDYIVEIVQQSIGKNPPCRSDVQRTLALIAELQAKLPK